MCDEIVIDNGKRRNMEKKIFLHKSPYNRSFKNEIHSLPRWGWCQRKRWHHLFNVCDAHR